MAKNQVRNLGVAFDQCLDSTELSSSPCYLDQKAGTLHHTNTKELTLVASSFQDYFQNILVILQSPEWTGHRLH